MAEEALCREHNSLCQYQCFLHKELLCSECKYDQNGIHTSCPVYKHEIGDSFPSTESAEDRLYTQCIQNYRNALALKDACSGAEDRVRRNVEAIEKDINFIFKTFNNKTAKVIKDTNNSLIDLKISSSRKFNKLKEKSNDFLPDVAAHMQKLVRRQSENNLSRLESQILQFEKIICKHIEEVSSSDVQSNARKRLIGLFWDFRYISLLQICITESNLIGKIVPEIEYLRNVGEIDMQASYKTITGCTVFQNGNIMLADNGSKKLKLFSSKGILNGSLETPYCPHDLSTISNQCACVSFPTEKVLIFFDIQNSEIKISQRKIGTENPCYGVVCSGGNIIVSCCSWILGLWQLCVFDTEDKLTYVINNDRLGRPFHFKINGYFDFCPVLENITFVDSNGHAQSFNPFGLTETTNLGKFGSQDNEILTSLITIGNAVITCHSEKPGMFYTQSSEKSVIRVKRKLSSVQKVEISGMNPSIIACNFDARIVVVVCDGYKSWINRGRIYGNSIFIFEF